MAYYLCFQHQVVVKQRSLMNAAICVQKGK